MIAQYSPGQGAREGPVSLSTNTSPLLEIHKQIAQGTLYTDPTQTIDYHSSATMFLTTTLAASTILKTG